MIYSAPAETSASNEQLLIMILSVSAGAVVAYLVATYVDHRDAVRGPYYPDYTLEELGTVFGIASHIALFLGVAGTIVLLGRHAPQPPASVGQLVALLVGSALLGSLVLWTRQFGRRIFMASAIGFVAATELLFAVGGLLGLHDLGILDTGLWAYVAGAALALLAGLVFVASAAVGGIRDAP